MKKNEIIKDLQNKAKQKETNNNNFTDITEITSNKDFDILSKEVITKNEHSNSFYTIYLLQDGRLAAGDSDKNIFIYNKTTFKSEMNIIEHSDCIMYLTQLKNGLFVSLGADSSINIYKLLDTFKYVVIQKIKKHGARVHKLRELDNDRFITCSDDCTIKFFFKDKNEYKEDYTFKEGFVVFNILRSREGEIVYAGYDSSSNSYICFYDLKSRKKINSNKVAKLYNGLTDNLYKISDVYLLVGGNNCILVFDVNQHIQIREIKTENSSCITSFLKINEKCLLSVDCTGNIKQWIIYDDNLILEKTKEKAHTGQIRMIRKNQDGLIITCSDDGSIKVWK